MPSRSQPERRFVPFEEPNGVNTKVSRMKRTQDNPIARSMGVLLVLVAVSHADAQQAGKPLQVYLLAGQSNMQGHAHVRTFDHIGMDPDTAPLLKVMRNEVGSPRTCENVWISSIGASSGDEEKYGQLTVGFGAKAGGPKIGPEFTFGIYTQRAIKQPMLIIKTAWGGKSLHTDFRPPSAGPSELSEQQLENLRRRGRDVAQAQAERVRATGHYYRLMIQHIEKVLGNIKRVCPDYDPSSGYELAGFVWFQGWNDMVDRGAYPNRGEPGGYDAYSDVLCHFIRDVRRDLSAPKLPFVIGVMGVGGPVDRYDASQQRYRVVHQEFRKAMAAPAAKPEFQGNVAVVLTENYWDKELSDLALRWDQVKAENRRLNQDKSLSRDDRSKALDEFTAKHFSPAELKTWETGASNAAYHYLGSAKIIGQIGQAFADALLTLR
ncbi:MAG: sialate O-acetylesterase [Planctomycetota bacterium]